MVEQILQTRIPTDAGTRTRRSPADEPATRRCTAIAVRKHPRRRWGVPAGLTIAISREAGSRGASIAKRAGEKLGWEVYSQDLLEYLDPAAGDVAAFPVDLCGRDASWAMYSSKSWL